MHAIVQCDPRFAPLVAKQAVDGTVVLSRRGSVSNNPVENALSFWYAETRLVGSGTTMKCAVEIANSLAYGLLMGMEHALD